MNNSPTLPFTNEKCTSQMEALLQLINLGYIYLSPAEAMKYREYNTSKYILEDIAFQAMRKINSDKVSDKSIRDRIADLQRVNLNDGNISASNAIYNSLIQGESTEDYFNGKKNSGHVKTIDWENVENNIFHITVEYTVSEEKNRRIDIVIFINGIPIAIIENKKPSVLVDEAINQIIHNSTEKNAPRFYLYPQIYIAANVTNLKYGTYKTPSGYYNIWKEKYVDDNYNQNIMQSINNKIDNDVFNKIKDSLNCADYKQMIKEKPSVQDIGIYGILRKERLIDIVKNFILYDNGIKKICRYNQYFAVRKTFETIQTYNKDNIRNGGLIWHTQGSGKSLTMVLLAKLIFEIIPCPRIIIVTDRIDLDDQIKTTFINNKLKAKIQKASSGQDLINKIKAKELNTIITTLVHKFNITEHIDNDNNVFIFVDEAHRTQYGLNADTMRAVLSKACIIGFTGTPLLSATKSKTIEKFGSIIDSYKMKEAEEDGAIVRLIYQGRFSAQHIDPKANKLYERITARLTGEQKADFLKKYLSSALMQETGQYIDMIGIDIAEHFLKSFQGTGLKGQIVAPSKYAAIYFQKWFELNVPELKTATIISDQKTGIDEDDTNKKTVEDYLNQIKADIGSLNKYETEIIKQFKKQYDGVEIIIVVDKLLTGFDAPRNTVLYLTKQLKDHNLMQAIARVNRVFDGDAYSQQKYAGLIIDYSANARNLKNAMALFNSYDLKDVEGMIDDPDTLIEELAAIYSKIYNTFASIKAKDDINSYIEFLKDSNNTIIREKFYNAVNECIKAFDMCQAMPDFHKKVDINQIKQYKDDLKKFMDIKKATKISMAEAVDFAKYKAQISKILDDYLSADEVQVLTKEIDISNVEEFNTYISNKKTGLSKKSQADAIIAQTDKIIKENYEKDPKFYGKFTDIINIIIEKIKQTKEEDIDALLNRLIDIQTQVDTYNDTSEKIPKEIANNKGTHAYYRLLKDKLKLSDDIIANITLYIYNLIENNKKVDFYKNDRIKNTVIGSIEDYFCDEIDTGLDYYEISTLAEQIWNTAVANK